MWIYQGVEQDMRKKTKRIFDDIIIGLKGKDALACLESLEKIQKDFLQDRDSLEGIQKKIDSYPLRSAISGVLLSLTLHYRKKMRKFSMPGI